MQKQSRNRSRFALSQQTIRALSGHELAAATGGMMKNSLSVPKGDPCGSQGGGCTALDTDSI